MSCPTAPVFPLVVVGGGGLRSSYSAWASHCGGVSACGARARGLVGSWAQ